ncbi:MAG: Maf family protein [Candidatus Cloacimonetes bacterium]|nr:Maf family protein [Candidatus Cloacimonadota bacterium]
MKLVGLKFVQIPAEINEDVCLSDHKNPQRYVQKLSFLKCKSIKEALTEDCTVIAADTTVHLDKKILGKPVNNDEAFYFLQSLSNKTHAVYTGLTVSYKNITLTDYTKTKVKFFDLSNEEIYQYIKTNEPFDKAGAYGIQGYGSQFIEKINGCYFNVMGFPINLFYQMIKKIACS